MFSYPFPQTLPYLPSLYSQPLLNNNYTLQSPPQQKVSPSAMSVRNSFPGSTGSDLRISPTRHSEPRQMPSTPQHQQNPVFTFSSPSQQNQYQQQTQYQQQNQFQQQNMNQQYQTHNHNPQTNCFRQDEALQDSSLFQTSSNQNQSVTNLQIQNSRLQREKTPLRSSQDKNKFITPLPQMGALTTTDSEGRLRVIVPVPSSESDDSSRLLANLRLTDTLRPLNGPGITRSTSEKVPNRSELMNQVQRTTWARHTTK